jgi:hypothetical protein
MTPSGCAHRITTGTSSERNGISITTPTRMAAYAARVDFWRV